MKLENSNTHLMSNREDMLHVIEKQYVIKSAFMTQQN